MQVATGVVVDDAALAAFCRDHAIASLRLFGSALRDQLGTNSDIDLLVEFLPDRVPGLLTMAQLELDLGLLFGREVELRTPRDLSPHFRDEVTARARPLYDAA